MITKEARRAAHDSRAQERGTDAMITKEAIEALREAYSKYGQTFPCGGIR